MKKKLIFYFQACEPPTPKYDYDEDGCRGCDCVASVTCPQLLCKCPRGWKHDTDINGCPTCECRPSIKFSAISHFWHFVLNHFTHLLGSQILHGGLGKSDYFAPLDEIYFLVLSGFRIGMRTSVRNGLWAWTCQWPRRVSNLPLSGTPSVRGIYINHLCISVQFYLAFLSPETLFKIMQLSYTRRQRLRIRLAVYWVALWIKILYPLLAWLPYLETWICLWWELHG